MPLLNWHGRPEHHPVRGRCDGAGRHDLGSVRASQNCGQRVLAGVLLLLIAVNYSGRLIDVVYAKGMFRDKSWVELRAGMPSRAWKSIARASSGKAIVIDADASTYIMNVDPHAWQGTDWQKNLMSAPPALANVLRPHGEFAIIGPGGGVDVLRAVANGSPSVTGIEINPIIANYHHARALRRLLLPSVPAAGSAHPRHRWALVRAQRQAAISTWCR